MALITLSVIVVMFSYSVVSVLICKVVLEFLLLYNKNKKLISTIKQVIEAFPEGVVIRDDQNNKLSRSLLYANHLAKDNLNLSDAGLEESNISQPKFSFCSEENKNSTFSFIEILEKMEDKVCKNKMNNEICIKMIQGLSESSNSSKSSIRYFTLKTINVEWEASECAFMHVFINISNIKRLEKEKATNKWLHIMFASISHEFRTPLNSFTNSLDLLKINFDTIKHLVWWLDLYKSNPIMKKFENAFKNVDKFITAATISSKTLESLTEDILDFAKIEAQMFTLNERPFILEDLIKDVTFIFDFQWRQKGLKLEVNSRGLDKIELFSDIGRIKQVVVNLLSNAYKFTNEGSITLNFKIFEQNHCEHRPRILTVEVIDTGVGISDSDNKGLFQLFGTMNNANDQFNMKGTGLGLTISKKLVTLMGGQIKLKSSPGKGTKVEFTIKEKVNEDEEVKFMRKHNNSKSTKPIERTSMFKSTQHIKSLSKDRFEEDGNFKLLILYSSGLRRKCSFCSLLLQDEQVRY